MRESNFKYKKRDELKKTAVGSFQMGKKLTSFLALLVLKVLGAGCVLAAVRDPKTAGPKGSKEPVITGSV